MNLRGLAWDGPNPKSSIVQYLQVGFTNNDVWRVVTLGQAYQVGLRHPFTVLEAF